MYNFSGKTAIVTGAGGGMGLQVSRDLLAAGANVTMIDLKEKPSDIDADDSRVLYRQGDLTDDGFVRDTVDGTASGFGGVDYLVNAAGILLFGRDQSVVDIDFDVWDRVFDVNLKGCARTIRACVPHMIKGGGGAMVHFSTVQCYRGDTKPQDAYQASKSGLIALSKSAAIQFAGEGIRSNILVPGMIHTPMQARWDENPELKEQVAAAVPLKRVGTVKDISNVCLFLLSDLSSYVTGTELIVDGGLLARP